MKHTSSLMAAATLLWSGLSFASADSSSSFDALFSVGSLPNVKPSLFDTTVPSFGTALKRHRNCEGQLFWEGSSVESLNEVYAQNISPADPSRAYYGITYKANTKIVGVFEMAIPRDVSSDYRAIAWSFGRKEYTDGLEDMKDSELNKIALPALIFFAFDVTASQANPFKSLLFKLPLAYENKEPYAPFKALDPMLNPTYRFLTEDSTGISGTYFKARYFETDRFTGDLFFVYTLSREDAALMKTTLQQKTD